MGTLPSKSFIIIRKGVLPHVIVYQIPCTCTYACVHMSPCLLLCASVQISLCVSRSANLSYQLMEPVLQMECCLCLSASGMVVAVHLSSQLIRQFTCLAYQSAGCGK